MRILMTTKNLQDQMKAAVGKKAAEFVKNGMTVGLGTGSTSEFFIAALIEKFQREHLDIRAVATSSKSRAQAENGGIQVLELDDVVTLDITFDGADEIDPQKRMIKGGGGAHTWEKIVACASREMVVMIDQSKVVRNLGRFPLPIEIIPYGHKATIKHITDGGFHGKLRTHPNGLPFVTDSHNYIFDIQLNFPCFNPEEVEARIAAMPGIVETGFFFGIAGRVIVGLADGGVRVMDQIDPNLISS
jgi:ribose 5-phosphate isomerase A